LSAKPKQRVYLERGRTRYHWPVRFLMFLSGGAAMVTRCTAVCDDVDV
jgi:hypothetical protein